MADEDSPSSRGSESAGSSSDSDGRQDGSRSLRPWRHDSRWLLKACLTAGIAALGLLLAALCWGDGADRRTRSTRQELQEGRLTLTLDGTSGVAASKPGDSFALPSEVPGQSLKLWPNKGETLLFIGQDNDNIDGYIDAFGVPPGFSMYVRLKDVRPGLLEPGDWGAGVLCADCLLKKYGKGIAFNLAIDMVDRDEDVAAGFFDDHVSTIVDWVKQTGGPVYLRPGYEFDGMWNHFEPATYVAAYRRIVDIFRKRNASNVLFVWHSAIYLTYNGHDLLDWYPGDHYVDLFGASVFTQPYPEDYPLKKLFDQEMSKLVAFAELGASRGKPLVILESAPRSSHLSDAKAAETAWDVWFQPLLEFVRKYDVRALAYINCNWDAQAMWKGAKWGDTRLQTNAELSKRWREEMTKPRWDWGATPPALSRALRDRIGFWSLQDAQ